MSSTIRDRILDMLIDFVCYDEELGYCNNCPLLRYEEDINYYDCPYALDCASCEYSPVSQLETDVDKIMLTIEACKP